VVGEGAGEGDPLALPAGELGRTPLGEPIEVDRREQLEGAVTLLVAAPASAQHRDLDVVDGAEMGSRLWSWNTSRG
jgi:hypothetical protein